MASTGSRGPHPQEEGHRIHPAGADMDMRTSGPSPGRLPGHQGGRRPLQGVRVGGWSPIWAASRQGLLPVAVELQPPLQSPSSRCALAAGTLSAPCRCLPVGVIQGRLSPERAGGKHLPGGASRPVPSAKPAALALPASQTPHACWVHLQQVLGSASAPAPTPPPGTQQWPCWRLFPPSGKATRCRGT